MKQVKSLATDHSIPEVASDDEKWYLTVIYTDHSVWHGAIPESVYDVIGHLKRNQHVNRERN